MGRKPKNNSEKSGETEVMQTTIDRITERRTFEPYDRPTVGCYFYRFRKRGDSIEGALGFPIVNFQQGTSYPVQLDDGEIVEVVANKLLHRQIDKGQLCGQRVRIEYQGRLFLANGHYRKIYRVFKVNHPVIFSRQQWDKIIEESKSRRFKNAQRSNMQKLSG